MNMRMAIGLSAILAASSAVAGRSVFDLSGRWQFCREDAGKATARSIVSDGAWSDVKVPHDWAIAGPYDRLGDGETAKLPWKGVGWYRRVVELSRGDFHEGFSAHLEFDGVMANPQVWVNGTFVGGWDYGYMGFRVDVTEPLRRCLDGAGSPKAEILVRADTREHASRWYPGAGMFRTARLVVQPSVRLVPGGVFVTTPVADRERGVVCVAFEAVGATRATVTVKDERGATVAAASGVSPLPLEVKRPALWNLRDAHLYTAEVAVGDDRETVRFGFRTFRFDPDDGFHLNGKRVQLKGVNLHHDLGPLGAAFNRSAARRQLEKMAEAGANALRTSHNPPAPEVLDICDELGLFVWDECFDKWDRTAGRTPDKDLAEHVSRNLRAFVRRDRNHPCVFVWSIGNEIWNDGGKDFNGVTRDDGMSATRNAAFRAAVREADATRPVGAGYCYYENVENGAAGALDITGYNYGHYYGLLKSRHPEFTVLCSESAAAASDRGAFNLPPPSNGHDFATNAAVWGASAYDHCAGCGDIPDMEFNRMEKDRYCAGEFIWTGFDYLGEPFPYGKDGPHRGILPVREQSRSASYGICDLMGDEKERYWLYRSHWAPEKTTVFLLPHWTWPGHEGKNVPVYAYSNGDEAELFVNGKSQGRRRKLKADCEELKYYPLSPRLAKGTKGGDWKTNEYFKIMDKYRFRWKDVAYEPGELRVVAYRDGRRIGESAHRTAGASARLVLEPERKTLPADGEELVYVRVRALDAQGEPAPWATNRVAFAAEGALEIRALGCGSSRCYEPFSKTDSHALSFGTAWAVVARRAGAKGGGALTASADGLAPDRCLFAAE